VAIPEQFKQEGKEFTVVVFPGAGQFDLDADAGQLFLERLRTFLWERLGGSAQP